MVLRYNISKRKEEDSMKKQRLLMCFCVLCILCALHIADIFTYVKIRNVNNDVAYMKSSFEESLQYMQEQIMTTQENYTILYNEHQSLSKELQNLKDAYDDLYEVTLSLQESQIVAKSTSNRWGITLTDEEIELLARIVMLEAGGEQVLGQEAVVEVIFNRIYREDFPDTLYDVLSQKRQFATWKNRNIKAATPTDEVYASIKNVLSGETHILPYETVYFGLAAENSKKQTVIGNHVFCNQY